MTACIVLFHGQVSIVALHANYFNINSCLHCIHCLILLQVGIDLIGPLPTTTKGNKYVVTLVEYFSKWPEAAPLQDKSAASVAQFLYEVFCRYIINSCRCHFIGILNITVSLAV